MSELIIKEMKVDFYEIAFRKLCDRGEEKKEDGERGETGGSGKES